MRDSNVHPLVALFQGNASGWFCEGRDSDLAPANLMACGRGPTADLALVRGFREPTTTPHMYEIRLRSYRGHWQDAAYPYVDWLERDAGFIPLDRKQPGWAGDLRNQAQLRVCDFEGLDALATRLDPARTRNGFTSPESPPIRPISSITWPASAKKPTGTLPRSGSSRSG